MLTVFAILLIVIYGGKLLIKVVNAIAPEEVAQAKKTVAQSTPGAVDAPTMAVLQVVVKQLPAYVNSYNIKDYGINGCTLLGDGSISIILDVANLYTAQYNA